MEPAPRFPTVAALPGVPFLREDRLVTHSVVISGTGLWTPEQSITNEELVASFNEYVARHNERHADAIGQASVHLALNDHRVDAGTAVVDGDEAADLDLGRARINVDYTDVGAEGVGEVLGVVADRCLEATLDAVR